MARGLYLGGEKGVKDTASSLPGLTDLRGFARLQVDAIKVPRVKNMKDTPDASDEQQTPQPPPQTSSNRVALVILAYLGFLALIPLLVEPDDPEVQWHAKHGLVLTLSWIALFVALAIISALPGLGLIIGFGFSPFLLLIIFFFHLFAIVKALQGERLTIPVISDYADKW